MKTFQAVALFPVGLLLLRPSQGRRLLGGDDAWRSDDSHERTGSDSKVGRVLTEAKPSRLAHSMSNKQGSGRLSCPSGTYNNEPASSFASCQPCPLGTFADAQGSDRCTPCPSGSYAPVTGSASCLPCDPSYYDGTGSDYGYSSTAATTASGGSSGTMNSANDLVYCVAPLYPANDTYDDNGTASTEPPTSCSPSAAPTMAPSVRSSSSSPSSVPTIAGSSAMPATTAAPTPGPSHRHEPQGHLPWPWHPHRSSPPSPSGASITPTARPTVRRRWNFAEGEGSNRTEGVGTNDQDDTNDASDRPNSNFRPFLPLLALSAALTLAGGAFAVKMIRQQHLQRRQLVTKTYSSRPHALPSPSTKPSPASPPPFPPPPPLLLSSSFHSTDTALRSSELNLFNDVESDSSSDYWSADSSLTGIIEERSCGTVDDNSSSSEDASTSEDESPYDDDDEESSGET